MAADSKYELLFCGQLAATIGEVFSSDNVWFGKFEIPIIKNNHMIEAISKYIEFVVDWNERTKLGLSADPAEFDPYDKYTTSKSWIVRDALNELEYGIADGPNFFAGNEISWITS